MIPFLELKIDGPPVSWQRTAHVARPKADGSIEVRRVSDRKAAAYKRHVRTLGEFLKREMGNAHGVAWPLDARYEVRLDVWLPSVRNDVDNLGKIFADALEGVFWSNDWRIFDMRVVKHIDKQHPRAVLRAQVLEQE